MGDYLIVSVVADRFVEKGRLVQDEEWRVRMLAALRVVDQVVLSEAKDSPCELLERLKPALYVRGPDYVERRMPDSVVAARLGIECAFTKTVLGVSTTKLKQEQRDLTLLFLG